jgi:IS5 family transposase
MRLLQNSRFDRYFEKVLFFDSLAYRKDQVEMYGVDATLIAAPSLTKNTSDECDPEMQQIKKRNKWDCGMKAHIGVDADSGLVHTVVETAGDVNDVAQVYALVHGKETDVFAEVS